MLDAILPTVVLILDRMLLNTLDTVVLMPFTIEVMVFLIPFHTVEIVVLIALTTVETVPMQRQTTK